MDSKQHKVFQEPPDGLDENWRLGALLGGITHGGYDWRATADAFKTAGDVLIQSVPGSFEGYELVSPALYCYRHAIELYLKTILGKRKTHNLDGLLQELIAYIKDRYHVAPPTVFTELILEFDEYDKKSDAFRYPDPGVISGEWWIDFTTLKRSMDYLQRCFHQLATDLH